MKETDKEIVKKLTEVVQRLDKRVTDLEFRLSNYESTQRELDSRTAGLKQFTI